jgi:hypothetical protein
MEGARDRTRWLHPSERARPLAAEPFDPVFEGAGYQLPAAMLRALWDQIARDGRASVREARRRFHERAAELAACRPAVGKRTRAELEAPAVRLGYDDHRVRGLVAMLDRVGPDLPLRAQLVATAAAEDRWIAGRATRWCEPMTGAATPAGHALWCAAERHAVALFRHAAAAGEVDPADPAVEAALARRGGGRPLDPALRVELEPALGVALAGVRVHDDAVADAAAAALHAEAFTIGQDVFFAAGKLAPHTRAGRALLVHELAHVAQALAGRTASARGVSRPGDPLEREADEVAARLAPAVRPPDRAPAVRDPDRAPAVPDPDRPPAPAPDVRPPDRVPTARDPDRAPAPARDVRPPDREPTARDPDRATAPARDVRPPDSEPAIRDPDRAPAPARDVRPPDREPAVRHPDRATASARDVRSPDRERTIEGVAWSPDREHTSEGAAWSPDRAAAPEGTVRAPNRERGSDPAVHAPTAAPTVRAPDGEAAAILRQAAPRSALPPAAGHALHGIEAYYLVESLPRTAGVDTRFLIDRGPYLLAPQMTAVGDRGAIVYYLAYRKDAARNEWVVGPDALPQFLARTETLAKAGDLAYLFGPPRPNVRASVRAVRALLQGQLGDGLRAYGNAWLEAVKDPTWWIQLVLAGAGAARAPMRPPPSLTVIEGGGGAVASAAPRVVGSTALAAAPEVVASAPPQLRLLMTPAAEVLPPALATAPVPAYLVAAAAVATCGVAATTQPAPAPATEPAPEREDRSQPDVILHLPAGKVDRLSTYQSLVYQGRLIHQLGKDRGNAQVKKWDAALAPGAPEGIAEDVFERALALGLTPARILRPDWSRQAESVEMQVDHIVELQLVTAADVAWADTITNYELLDARANQASGSRLRQNIRRERERLAARTGDPAWLTRDLVFTEVLPESGSRGQRWRHEEIQQGLHLLLLRQRLGE